MPLTQKEVQMFNEQFQRVIDSNEATIKLAIDNLRDELKSEMHEVKDELSETNNNFRLVQQITASHEKRIHKLETAK